MKRARNKKTSIFSRKSKQPARAHIDFEINESDFTPTSGSDFEPEITNEPTEFAVPDEVIEESLTRRDYTAEDVIAEDFAVSDEELNESLVERNYTVADVTADEFAPPDEELDMAIKEESMADDYDDIPDEEIPFSTDDYTTEYIEDTVSSVVAPSANDASNKRGQNRAMLEKKMRRRRTVTICISVFLLFIVTSLALLGVDFSSNSGNDFLTPVDTATGKINVLLLGVDKDGERSDSIMLISYDFDTHKINLMSVPRDTKMYVTDRNVTRKITEVHGMHDSSGKMYGAAAVAESVSSLTGIPINYYLEFSFDALDNVMDILGPVTFDVPDIEGGGRGMNYDDDFQNLHIHLKPGVQELSGNQIQQFLRYRKSNYGASDGSDTSRIGRQQELLKAIIDQKLNVSFILKVPDIFKEVKSQLKTNFSLRDVIKYAGYLKDISSDNMTTYVLPGESKLSGAWYHICDFDQTAEVVTTEFGYEVTANELTNEISLTGKKASGKTNSQKSESNNNSKTDDDDSPITSKKNDEKDSSSTTKKADEANSSSTNNSSNNSNTTANGTNTEDTNNTDTPDTSVDYNETTPDNSETNSDDEGIISLD